MHFVDQRSGLEDAARSLEGAPRLYIDTEFESSRQGKLLCLLQISRGEELFLIDALRLRDLGPLAGVLSSTSTEWVVHAGQQDVELLVECLRLRDMPRLFDTQIAWALVGPEFSVSLAYLQFRLLGLRTSKSHQSDDWKRRPLPPAQLAYAAQDIEHLPELRRMLGERLEKLGREHAVFEASLESVQSTPESRPKLTLSSFRNAWQLDRHGQAALRYLIEWYDALDECDRSAAPEPKVLLAIASRLPESAEELSRMKGVPRRFANAQGDRLTGGMMRATAEAEAADFVPIDPPPYASFEEIRLDAWLSSMRAELCEALSVAPELAFPGRVLRRVRSSIQESGRVEAGAEALEGWRSGLLARAFVDHARRNPPRL